MARVMSTGPRPWSPWLRKVWPPKTKLALSWITCVALRLPVLSAMIDMKGLKVEPGG